MVYCKIKCLLPVDSSGALCIHAAHQMLEKENESAEEETET